MMKKKKMIALVCAGVLVVGISICLSYAFHNKKDSPATSQNSENPTGEDPFETVGEDEESHSADPGGDRNSVSGGIVSVSGGTDGMTLHYDGTPVLIEYEFKSESPCVLGMMIYVNGLLQPYTVSGEETTMHTIQMSEEDTKRFTLEFTPVCGKAGQELVIEFANIYNAKVMELKGGANTFGNSHKVFQSMPYKLELSTDSPMVEYEISDSYETRAFSEADWADFIRTDKDGKQRNILDDVCEIELCRDGKRLEEKSVFQEKEAEELSVQLYGNLTGKYRVSLYGDFQRIPINGYDYVEVVIEKGAYTVVPFSLDLKEVKAKNLCAVAAPMEGENFVVKSPTIYLGRE